MRKIVPPQTPARPPAMPPHAPAAAAGSAAAPYGAVSRARRDVRWARVAFWVAVVYALGVIGWRAWDRGMIRLTHETMRGVSLSEWFAVSCWGFALAPPLMAVANVLPALAFWRAARGRYSGGIMIAYAMIQVALIVVEFSAIASLVSQGTITYVQNGLTRNLHMGRGIILPSALIAAGLCVPLVALLVPPLRRACFDPPT